MQVSDKRLAYEVIFRKTYGWNSARALCNFLEKLPEKTDPSIFSQLRHTAKQDLRSNWTELVTNGNGLTDIFKRQYNDKFKSTNESYFVTKLSSQLLGANANSEKLGRQIDRLTKRKSFYIAAATMVRYYQFCVCLFHMHGHKPVP